MCRHRFAYLSAYFVIVIVHDGYCFLFAHYCLVVDISRQLDVAVFVCFQRPLYRRGFQQRRFTFDKLSGELRAPPDVFVASAPLERAVCAVRVGAAPTTRQHSGCAVPGHGVRQGSRAKRVHERLFFRACKNNINVEQVVQDSKI